MFGTACEKKRAVASDDVPSTTRGFNSAKDAIITGWLSFTQGPFQHMKYMHSCSSVPVIPGDTVLHCNQ